MSGGHWAHTSWRSNATAQTVGNPLEPGGVHGGMLANEVVATSESDVTVITARYEIQLTMWVEPDSSGNPLVDLEDAGLLGPVMLVTVAPASSGPWPNPWTGSQSQADFIASDGMLMDYDPVQSKLGAGFVSYAFTWRASGETHGMRKLAGPVEAAAQLIIGWNYNSFLANYAPQRPGIGWTLTSYLRAKFGSSSSLT